MAASDWIAEDSPPHGVPPARMPGFRNRDGVVNTVRVDKAKQLLASSSLPVTDIAYRIGFHDANYFSRQFKKSTGVTPGDFRKQAVQ